jgi:hypothetical protein
MNVYLSGQLILYSMNHFAKTSFVVVAATIALAATLVNGFISEASAQTNSNSSNASSMGPKVGSQKIVVNSINFTGSILYAPP